MPWRLPAIADFTLPLAVILKRFFAPDLVFNLGILISFKFGFGHGKEPVRPDVLKTSVLSDQLRRHGSPFSRAARGRVMSEDGGKDNPNGKRPRLGRGRFYLNVTIG